MKNRFLLIFLCFCVNMFSQQKYQNLLWEISGNGLEKSSYLYGTMHVSKKVAFRLDDVFFEVLDKSECVALESDPTTWLDFNYENMTLGQQNNSRSYRSDFYTQLFELSSPDEIMVRSAIRFDNNIINGYLYRKDPGADNFEEETYLDMFIYQAGKKKNKPIVGLEDIAESNYLTSKARSNAMKRKPDAWLQKLYSEENPYLLQENLYRERNLDLLDSIGSAVNTEYYRRHMLYIRNENMVKVLDSLMHEKSVFAGVGAAHLPGDQGMINMLVERGYTVKPLKSKQTDVGTTKKEALESLFTKPNLTVQTTPDQFISIKSFDKLREFTINGQKFYVAPDMTNGAYITLTRLNTYDYLPEKDPMTLDKINDLLYEDIPGDIIKKEALTTPFPGISILNKTKKGDYQKYHIYRTPLEIVIVKFGGIKDYVLVNEQEIFGSIQFKTQKDGFENFSSPYQKYHVDFPVYHISDNFENAGKKVLQGIYKDDYYFLEESPVFDIYYIEEDGFEAKYTHDAFYENLDLEEASGQHIDGTYKAYQSEAVIDSTTTKRLHLKSVIKDESYYLLGYYGSDINKADTFFESFKFKPIVYPDYEKVIDTSLYFSANSQTKSPPNNRFYFDRNEKPYEMQTKQAVYTTKANEQITITRTKYHDLHMMESVDSIWNNIDKSLKFTSRYKQEKDIVITNQKKSASDDIYTYSYALKDSTSAKAILVKHILKEGVMYELKSLTDSISSPSPFVTEFYDSFTPMDTLLGESVFKDKTAWFFEALEENDSLVLNGYSRLIFKNQHVDQLINAIDSHEYQKNQAKIKLHLINELGQLSDPKARTFLEDLYKKSYAEPEVQSTILKSYLKKKDKASYDKLLSLMEQDLPLDSKNINSIFRFRKDSLQLVGELFPKILQFSAIEEYKNPIYELLAKVVDSNLVKPKAYKKYKNQIITDGKIEVKRYLGRNNFSSYNNNSSDLESYVTIIFPYREDKQAKDFFEKLIQSDDDIAINNYFTLLTEADEQIPLALSQKTILNEKNHWALASALDDKGLLTEKFKNKISQQSIAKSRVFTRARFSEERDSISFLTKKEILTDNNVAVDVYVFKLKRTSSYGDNEFLHYVTFQKPEKEALALKIYDESGTNGTRLNDSKTEEEFVEDIQKLVSHKTRKRINSSYDFEF
ncbi:TraB/GumN family protein [Subsaxibacter sp. CAU 1640]|uniref:TraB/GumN family protein n=1 Tax=Subsaxibacter sp. CAU 1640 TaxID=2933271 RepID=UPI002005E124|nr:TraB/GumN family protein [Subsaxibacter sp. CAU 1640]MCK7589600.1 TraB/GumN family protein [Subsaxibacter sp. CAU 1640]